MRQIPRRMLPALLAVLALSAAVASAAQAADAPHYTVEAKTGEAKRLGAGETRNFAVKAFSNLSFNESTFGIETKCTTMSVKTGAQIIGSAAGEPGTGTATLEAGNCSGREGQKTCTPKPFVSKPLKFELVQSATNKDLYVLVKPVSGKVLAEWGPGTGCSGSSPFEGNLVLEARYEKAGGGEGGPVEVGTTITPAKAWLLNLIVSPPANVITFKAGVETKTKVAPLEWGATPASLEGAAAISLANGNGELTAEPWGL